MSPDSRGIAWASGNGIHVLDAATGTLRRQWRTGTAAVETLAFTPDSGQLAVMTNDGTVRLWHVADGREIVGPIPSVAIALITDASANAALASAARDLPRLSARAPDGRRQAVRDKAGSLVLVSTAGAKLLRRFASAPARLSTWPVFTPDGRTVITAVNGSVQFWEVATGNPIARPTAHRAGVRELTVAGDGRLLVSVGDERSALVWDLHRLATANGATLPLDDADRLWHELANLDAAPAGGRPRR